MGKILKLLKSVDAFGAPIALNFRGSSSFNTACGGAITVLTLALVAWLTIALAIDMLKFEGLTIQTYTKAEVPKEPINLFENKFILTVKLGGFAGNSIDPRAGILELGYFQRISATEQLISEPSDRIPLELC